MTTSEIEPGPWERQMDFCLIAGASYRKHFADPVAAAEADWIGRAIECLQSLASTSIPGATQARELLSQTKEPTA